MINVIYLDNEIFDMEGSDKNEVYELWNYYLRGINEEFKLFLYDNAEDTFSKIKELGNNTIIILDMQMPQIDGPTFLKKVRENDYTIPVIGYTAEKDETMFMDLLKNDIFSYVIKAQGNYNELTESINKAIEKFKDNIPLELGEALNEYLDRNPQLKDEKVIVKKDGENKEISFSEIQDHLDKGTTFGKDYQKAIYKIAFEDFKEKRKVIE